MPIYGYKCYECKHEFDVLCKYEEKVQPCPQCEQIDSTKRQLSAPTFNMKKGPYDSYL